MPHLLRWQDVGILVKKSESRDIRVVAVLHELDRAVCGCDQLHVLTAFDKLEVLLLGQNVVNDRLQVRIALYQLRPYTLLKQIVA